MLPWEPRGLSGSLSQAVTPTPSLPSPSRPVAPTLAPLSTGGPDLSPLPALATPTCGLCQPQIYSLIAVAKTSITMLNSSLGTLVFFLTLGEMLSIFHH